MFNILMPNEPVALTSLAAWSKPKLRRVRAAVAMGMSLAFVFPTLSWAFEVRSEVEQGSARIETATGVDPALARQFSVPARFGRIVEATPAQGGPTLLLVQDLHCNVEVQNNIQGILLNWQRRNPQLGLVAVEGATGIIPTQELLSLSDTPAKRAVLNYFLKEGKLTGADVLAVTARPDWELFGAEDADLYDRSLILIEKFATDENRGLVFELMDQVRFLRSRTYHPDLLAFEQRRDAVLRGRLGSDEYHGILVQEARALSVPLLPADTATRGFSGAWDLQDRIAQDLYLENAIRTALFRTDDERRLYETQRFVELAEQLLTVSLSQTEVEEFRARRRTTSLSGIQKDVQAELRKLDYAAGLDTRFGSDIAALDPLLEQGLEFYQLAEARNTALFERTVARARERNDRVAALVIGGFHARAIGALARRQGLGCVCVRPAQDRPDTANNYFQLLRNPDQPTELETLVARLPHRGTAIAVRNFVATHGARLRRTVGTVEEAWGVLQGRTSDLSSRAVRVTRNTVRFLMPEGGRPLFLTFAPRNQLEINERSPQPAVARPAMRTVSLALLGLGLSAVVVIALTGGALLPGLTFTAVTLIGLGLWAWNNPESFTAVALNRRNVVAFSLLLGLSFLGVVALPALAEHLLLSAGVALPGIGHLAAVGGILKGVLAGVLPMAAAQRKGTLETVAVQITSFMANLVATPLFTIPLAGAVFMSLAAQRVAAMGEQARFGGQTLEDQLAALTRTQLEQQTEANLGIRHSRTAMTPGSVAVASDEVVLESSDVLRANRLVNFEGQVAVQTWCQEIDVSILAPEPGKEKYADTPINSHFKIFRFPFLMTRILKGRINVIDPVFIGTSEGGVPQDYIRAVLNVMNANVMSAILGEGGRLRALLERALENADFFREVLRKVTIYWRSRQLQATPEVFSAYLLHALLHERVHFLINALPAGDIPEDQRARLSEITFEKYAELLFRDPALLTTSAGAKNLGKALMSAEKMTPSAESRETIMRTLTIEMFCDRFAMFLWENYQKQKVLQAALGVTTWPLRANVFADLDRAMQAGAGALAEFLRANGATRAQDAGWVEGVMRGLQEAERTSALVQHFGDPAITPAERKFFQTFHEHLAHFDAEGTINQFTDEHCATSVPIITFESHALSAAGMSMGDASVVARAADTPGTPVGLAVVAGQNLLGQTTTTGLLDVEEPSGTGTSDEDLDDLFGPPSPGTGSGELSLRVGLTPVQKGAEALPLTSQTERLQEVATGIDLRALEVEEGEVGELVEAPSLPMVHVGFTTVSLTSPQRQEAPDLARDAVDPATRAAQRNQSLRLARRAAQLDVKRGQRTPDEGPIVDMNGLQANMSYTSGMKIANMMAAPQAEAPAAVSGSMPTFLSSVTQGRTADTISSDLGQLFGVWQDLMNRAPAPPPDPMTLPFYVYSNASAWQGLNQAAAAVFQDQFQGDPELQALSEAFLNALRFEPLTNSGPNSYEGVQASGRNGVVLLTRPVEAYVPNSERLTGVNAEHYAELAMDLVNRLVDRYAPAPGQEIPAITLRIADPALQSAVEAALDTLKTADRRVAALAQGLTIMPLGSLTPAGQPVVVFSDQDPVPVVISGGERGVLSARELVDRLLAQYATTPGQPIPALTLQIADPVLRSAVETYLAGLKATGLQGAALAQALTLVTPATRTPGVGPQVAVFTPQNPVPIEISRSESGALSVLVGQPFVAISRSVEVSGEAARQSAVNLSQVSNSAAFAGFYLLTAEQVKALALQNFQGGAAWAVTGMVNIENARLAADQQSAIRALAQRLLQVQPDLGASPGQKATLWYDAAQAAQKQALLAQGRAFDLEITYGAESADVSSKVLSLLVGVLDDETQETPREGRVTGAGVLALGTLLETPTQADLMNETALAAAERAAAAAWRTSLATDTDLQEALRDLTGSREPGRDTLAVLRDALRDRVSGQSAVVVVSRAAGKAEPTHALRTEVAEVLRAYVGPSRTKGPDFVDPYGATEVQPEDYPGLEVQVTGEFKTFSRVALALAGMRLVGRALTGYAGSLLRGLRNPRDLIPNFRFVLPTFLKALRIMFDIVVGRFGVQRVTDPYLRQQIRLLLELEKSHGTDLARVPAGQVPETLSPVMPQLLRLRQFLNNPLFGAMFRALGVNIDDLNVYLLLLLDRYQTMDQLRWYLTPGSYLRSAVQDTRTDLSPGVRRALVGSARFQRTLTRLDQRASPRLVRSALWQIVALLNAKDLGEADRKALQVSVLRLLSRIDPARQTGIQARLDDGTLVQVQLPLVLLNTPQLLRGFYPHFDLYYQNGKRVPEPVQNMVVSTLQAA